MIESIAIVSLIIFSVVSAIRAYRNERQIEEQMLFFKRERDRKIDDLWGENVRFAKDLEDLKNQIKDRTYTGGRIMPDKIYNKMIITKVGYSSIPVALTDSEVKVLESFISWADLGDEYLIESANECSYEEWGE